MEINTLTFRLEGYILVVLGATAGVLLLGILVVSGSTVTICPLIYPSPLACDLAARGLISLAGSAVVIGLTLAGLVGAGFATGRMRRIVVIVSTALMVIAGGWCIVILAGSRQL